MHNVKVWGNHGKYGGLQCFIVPPPCTAGTLADACSSYEKVLQHAPDAVDARVRYASLLLQQRKPSQAHEAATVATGLDPKNAAAYAVRSKAKEALGDFKVGHFWRGGCQHGACMHKHRTVRCISWHSLTTSLCAPITSTRFSKGPMTMLVTTYRSSSALTGLLAQLITSLPCATLCCTGCRKRPHNSGRPAARQPAAAAAQEPATSIAAQGSGGNAAGGCSSRTGAEAVQDCRWQLCD